MVAAPCRRLRRIADLREVLCLVKEPNRVYEHGVMGDVEEVSHAMDPAVARDPVSALWHRIGGTPGQS